MMSGTYGPTSWMPFASYDPDTCCWRTSEATSLWALTLSSLTSPEWGGLQYGELFEHPTPDRLISGPASSSLPTPTGDDANNQTRSSGSFQSLTRTAQTLPTPAARDAKGPHMPDREGGACLAGALLPTPTSQAAKHGDTPDLGANAFGHNLWDLPTLLPTPAVMDMGKGRTPEEWDAWTDGLSAKHNNGVGHGKSLEIEAARIGANMSPRSADGRPSSGGPLPGQLSLDGTGDSN